MQKGGSTWLPGEKHVFRPQNGGLLPPAGAKAPRNSFGFPEPDRTRMDCQQAVQSGFPRDRHPDSLCLCTADPACFRMRQPTGLAHQIATALPSSGTVIKRIQIQVRPPFPLPPDPSMNSARDKAHLPRSLRRQRRRDAETTNRLPVQHPISCHRRVQNKAKKIHQHDVASGKVILIPRRPGLHSKTPRSSTKGKDSSRWPE